MPPRPSQVKDFAISYLWHKAITDQEKAMLSLPSTPIEPVTTLTNNSAGIGDHSTEDFYKNLDEALDILVDARDRLELLQERYPELVN